MAILITEDNFLKSVYVMKNMGSLPLNKVKTNVVMFKQPSAYISKNSFPSSRKYDYYESAIGHFKKDGNTEKIFLRLMFSLGHTIDDFWVRNEQNYNTYFLKSHIFNYSVSCFFCGNCEQAPKRQGLDKTTLLFDSSYFFDFGVKNDDNCPTIINYQTLIIFLNAFLIGAKEKNIPFKDILIGNCVTDFTKKANKEWVVPEYINGTYSRRKEPYELFYKDSKFVNQHELRLVIKDCYKEILLLPLIIFFQPFIFYSTVPNGKVLRITEDCTFFSESESRDRFPFVFRYLKSWLNDRF
jgi:hypothetical protein